MDKAIDAPVDWQEECLTLNDAYRRWSDADADHRRAAFYAFEAALEREQRASAVYEALCDRVARATT